MGFITGILLSFPTHRGQDDLITPSSLPDLPSQSPVPTSENLSKKKGRLPVRFRPTWSTVSPLRLTRGPLSLERAGAFATLSGWQRPSHGRAPLVLHPKRIWPHPIGDGFPGPLSFLLLFPNFCPGWNVASSRKPRCSLPPHHSLMSCLA